MLVHALVEACIFVHKLLRYADAFLKELIGVLSGKIVILHPGGLPQQETGISCPHCICSDRVGAVSGAVSDIFNREFEILADLGYHLCSRSTWSVSLRRCVGEDLVNPRHIAEAVHKLHIPPGTEESSD